MWLSSSTNNGRVGGAGMSMLVVDGEKEINLEWPYSEHSVGMGRLKK